MGIKSYKPENDSIRFDNAIVYFDIERRGVYRSDVQYVRISSNGNAYLVDIDTTNRTICADESSFGTNEEHLEKIGYVRLNEIPFSQLRIELIPALVRAHMGDIV